MKIETKFDIGQKVYTIEQYYDYEHGAELDIRLYGHTDKKHNEVKEWYIKSLVCVCNKEESFTVYEIESNGLIYSGYIDNRLFATREEAEQRLQEILAKESMK